MRFVPRQKPAGAGATGEDLGNLPEWNLTDLYPGMDSPEYARDVKTSLEESAAFEAKYAGKLSGLAEDDPGGLAEAVVDYERIESRMGRIMSYAGLVYTGNTTDPAKAKFYGDAQEKMTDAGSHLLFFTLELNRIADALLENAMNGSKLLQRYRPWIEDLRKERPYQLEDRIEQLFHEKSVTGRGAWNRLFDETMASLRFTVDGEELTAEPALNLLQHRDREKREAAAREIGRVLADNSRTFTLITNTLSKDKEISDRWRGFTDVAESRHLANRVEPEVVNALVEAVEK
ncbi:MAG: oligoendopeptidase F, partial [Nitratireductor sp.]|nr:oligoendopeptidase F [Nitratireductor sp.]